MYIGRQGDTKQAWTAARGCKSAATQVRCLLSPFVPHPVSPPAFLPRPSPSSIPFPPPPSSSLFLVLVGTLLVASYHSQSPPHDMMFPPLLGPMPLAEVQALPEFGPLRRSSAACAWLAPLSPALPADRGRLVTDADLLGATTPASLRLAVCLDSDHRTLAGGGGEAAESSDDGGDCGRGGTDGGRGVDGGGANAMPWDVAAAVDSVQGGILGARLALLSSISVPLATDGGVVLGAIVSDVLVQQPPGSGGLSDTGCLGRVGRFVFDSSTGELLAVTPRPDGRAVMVSHTVGCGPGCGTDLEWIVSVFGRPLWGERRGSAAGTAPPPSSSADDGHLPTLVSRLSSIMRRTEPYDASFKAVANAAIAAGGSADPVRHFRDLSLVSSTFGVAGPPEAGRDATAGPDGGVFPLTVLSVEPSSQSAIHRLSTLTLSCLSVQPARMRVAPPPATEEERNRGPAARRRRLLPLAPAPARDALATAGVSGVPPGVAISAGGQPITVAVATATVIGAGVPGGATPVTYLASGGAGTPAAPRTGARRRHPVDLAAITNPVVRARVMRNRASARASNERRRATRAAAVPPPSSPPPPPPLPSPPPPPLDTQFPVMNNGAGPS